MSNMFYYPAGKMSNIFYLGERSRGARFALALQIGSTYTWLSVSRAAKLAAERDVELVWQPFSARTLMREQNNIPFAGKPIKLRYMWRDLARRAARFGVPFTGIPPYPIDTKARERCGRKHPGL